MTTLAVVNKDPAPLYSSAEIVTLRDGSTAFVRKARPDDALLLPAYFAGFTDEDLYQRFFKFKDRSELCRNRAITFYRDAMSGSEADCLLVVLDSYGKLQGAGRAMLLYRNNGTPTYEVSFSARKKGNRVGSTLMTAIVRWATDRGEHCDLLAATLTGNQRMRWLLARYGFRELGCLVSPEISEFVRRV